MRGLFYGSYNVFDWRSRLNFGEETVQFEAARVEILKLWFFKEPER
jgi:hypothetical protein